MQAKRGSRQRYRPHKMVRVPLDTHAAAADLARRDERSTTATIARLLREALADRGQLPAPARDGPGGAP